MIKFAFARNHKVSASRIDKLERCVLSVMLRRPTLFFNLPLSLKVNKSSAGSNSFFHVDFLTKRPHRPDLSGAGIL